MKGKRHSRKSRIQMSKSRRKRITSEETKAKMSIAHRGERNHFFGRRHSLKTRQLISKTMTGRILSKEHRQKISDSCMGMEGRIFTKEIRQRMSESAKRRCEDPKYREWMLEVLIPKMIKAQGKRPTAPEQELMGLLESLGYPYKYTGDNSVLVAGVYPDFWWEEEQRVIEMFGGYWHEPEDEKIRIEKFKELGVVCLVIWENELANKQIVTQKIKSWHRSS